MKNERGFSLIELMIVLVILGVIMAIAVPGFRRAKQNAQMASAIQSLRTLTTAQFLFERKNKVYGTLAQLIPEGTIDNTLGSGFKSEYSFVLTLNATSIRYTITATPQADLVNMDYFFTDESGVIRFKRGAPADVTSTPIPR
jgi:prepilin-type N-terminal cleavage/methylation domain-containing protein